MKKKMHVSTANHESLAQCYAMPHDSRLFSTTSRNCAPRVGSLERGAQLPKSSLTLKEPCQRFERVQGREAFLVSTHDTRKPQSSTHMTMYGRTAEMASESVGLCPI